jgi:hypothetical protein
MRIGRSNSRIRELEAEVARQNQLFDFARNQVAQRDALLGVSVPVAAGMPAVAEQIRELWDENTDLRRRAVSAEGELAFLASAMVADAFPDN